MLRICLTAVYCTVENALAIPCIAQTFLHGIICVYATPPVIHTITVHVHTSSITINGSVEVWYQLAVLPYMSNWSDWFRLD